MKLSPVKPLVKSPVVKPLCPTKKDLSRKVKMLNAEFTLGELRTVYKEALQNLSHDKFGRK